MADETEKAIKLTRDDLRSIDVGKTKTFYLRCESVRQWQGFDVSVSKFDGLQVQR